MTKIFKENKSLIIPGLLLLFVLLAYFSRASWLPYIQGKKTTASSSGSNPTTVSTNSSPLSNDSILKKGSSGPKVRELQELLNTKHKKNTPQFLPLLVLDGQFGLKTETMLKKWTDKTSISINQLIKALV